MKRIEIRNRKQQRLFDAIILDSGKIYFEVKPPKGTAKTIAAEEVMEQIRKYK